MPVDAEWLVHLFVGTTLAATSVGITARVLKDLDEMGAPDYSARRSWTTSWA